MPTSARLDNADHAGELVVVAPFHGCRVRRGRQSAASGRSDCEAHVRQQCAPKELVHAMETVAENPAVPSRPADSERVGQQRWITSEEEAAILVRADEVNARIARILEEYG